MSSNHALASSRLRRTGLLFATVVLATLPATAQAQGLLDGLFGPPRPSQSYSEAGEPLMSPEQRRAMQRVLADRGFYRGAVNGSLSGATRRAIADWQADIGDRPTGFLTRRQLSELMRAAAALRPPAAEPAPPAVATAPDPAPVTPPAAPVAPSAAPAPVAADATETLRLAVGRPDAAAAAAEERQAVLLYARLSATALDRWVKENPGRPTPAPIVAQLAPLWLGDAQQAALLDGLGGAAPGLPAGQDRAARTAALAAAVGRLDPAALATLSERFDSAYRPLVLRQARPLPLKVTLVAERSAGTYDADKGGYPLSPLAETAPAGWPGVAVTLDGAEPAGVWMASEAAGRPERLFEARTLSVRDVRLSPSDATAGLAASAWLDARSFFADAQLTRPLGGPVPAATPASAPPAQGRYDIVGLRLGMDLSEAVRVLDAHMPGHRFVALSPFNTRLAVTFGNGRVYVSRDSTEYIALLTEPDRSGTRVVAVGRYVFAGLGAYDREDLIRDLSAKYLGQPLRSGALLHWGGPARPSSVETTCHLQLGTIGQAAWTDQRGAQPDWRSYVPAGAAPTFRGPASMTWIGLKVPDVARLSEYEGCGETVGVWLPDLRGRSGEFAIWLADPKAYLELLAGPPLAGVVPKPKL